MKKILICVDLENDSIDFLKKSLLNLDWKNVGEVHLIHAFQIHYYTDNFNISSFPTSEDQEGIQSAVEQAMLPIEEVLSPLVNEAKIIKKCLICNKPKTSIVEYTSEKSISEMIIATKIKGGFEDLFSSSFSEYMLKHANCSLNILRIK